MKQLSRDFLLVIVCLALLVDGVALYDTATARATRSSLDTRVPALVVEQNGFR
ncbi:hypothetical protein [Levilactobacillus angrenensis]|uniref:Uncharacterized protein n=1 Tax=Levilactobacillus angrenensis TaxID=2486020 RepID=A0ABW1U7E6_9LACO|nr:hypothetical protein [Levilactobacillus angrenensis]